MLLLPCVMNSHILEMTYFDAKCIFLVVDPHHRYPPNSQSQLCTAIITTAPGRELSLQHNGQPIVVCDGTGCIIFGRISREISGNCCLREVQHTRPRAGTDSMSRPATHICTQCHPSFSARGAANHSRGHAGGHRCVVIGETAAGQASGPVLSRSAAAEGGAGHGRVGPVAMQEAAGPASLSSQDQPASAAPPSPTHSAAPPSPPHSQPARQEQVCLCVR